MVLGAISGYRTAAFGIEIEVDAWHTSEKWHTRGQKYTHEEAPIRSESGE